jgi:hypothetical protein
MTESQLQQTCVRWFRYQFAYAAPFLIAVPNGGRRDAKTGALMKKEGAIAGVADLIFFDPFGKKLPLFIEMKLPKGVQSESQVRFERTYTQAGYTYIICRSFDEFKEVVINYMT